MIEETPSRPRVRVVLVDDHPIVRNGLKALLASVDDIEVVGEAGSGEQALAVVAATTPHVVIMDIDMPGMGGIEATRRLAKDHPGSAVLVLTMYGEDDILFAALRAGARGYLLKGAQQEVVLRTIKAVAQGDAVFSPGVADRLLRAFASRPPAPPFPELTEREREVLGLLADAASNTTIARRLGLTPKTIANHVSNILSKMQAADRAEAIVRARRAGLGAR